MLKDRRRRPVITHRISCGRVGGNKITKLDYFEITTFERASNGPYTVDVVAMDRLAREPFGDRYVFKREGAGDNAHVVGSRRIPIRVDSDEIEDFLTQRYESTAMLPVLDRFGARIVEGQAEGKTVHLKRPTVWCHGDGETALRMAEDLKTFNRIRCCSSPSHKPRTQKDLMLTLEAGAKAQNPEDGFRCPYAQNVDADAGPRCAPTTTLICRCDVVANIGAFCRYRSHAHSSADNVYESLLEIKRQMPGGILRGVPLDLVLEQKLIGRPGGKTALQPVAHIELRLAPEETVRLIEANLQQQMRSLGAVQESRRLLLEAKAEVVEEDDDGEFGTPKTGIEREQKPSGGIATLVGEKT